MNDEHHFFLYFHLFSCPKGFQFLPIISNCDFDSTSACYSNYFLCWIILLSRVLVLYTTDYKGSVRQHFYLYSYVYSCPLVYLVVLKIFNFYQLWKWLFGQHFCLLLKKSSVLDSFVVWDVGYVYHCSSRKFGHFFCLYVLLFSCPIFCLFALKDFNNYDWNKMVIGQHFFLLLDYFSLLYPIVVHNVCYVYHWPSS